MPTSVGDVGSNLVGSWNNGLTSTKAVGSQLALMSALSLVTLLAFSLLRPRDKRVYAPKIKYHQAVDQQKRASRLHPPNGSSHVRDHSTGMINPNEGGYGYEAKGQAGFGFERDREDHNAAIEDPFADAAPPPPIRNGFFSWFSPVLHVHEEAMLEQIGLDGVTFLRVLRLLRICFSAISVIAVGVLLPIYVVWNKKKSTNYNFFSMMTVQNLSGSIMWAPVAATYIIIFIVCYFVWYHWKKMVLLRQSWFRSRGYRRKIYSRTLMVTLVPKDYRTDEGLVHLMGKLKVDGIKIGQQIDCTSIGRKLEDFPDLVEEHNNTVRALEEVLVKYLKNDQIASKRPTAKIGSTLGLGGTKVDAIDHHAKKVKELRDKIEAKRADIDALIRKDRNARKQKKSVKPHGENYGFVTFKTIAEAHRIARAHRGRLKELGGAELSLAPPSRDLIWKNVTMEPSERSSKVVMGFIFLGVVCFFNTVPLLAVSILANLTALAVYVPFLDKWKGAGQWGEWTFSIVSGILPPTISALFGFFLPIIMRRLTKYQGAITRSRLDRAVMARYFAFLIISNFLTFSLFGAAWNAVAQIIEQAGEKKSFKEIMDNLDGLPNSIQQAYIQLSVYWLTAFPLRGFLVIFEIAQLIKLLLLSVQRLLFAKTPRDIKEYTKPPYFETSVVLTNMLFSAAVALVYAPLAPLVCLGFTLVFWLSSFVYKYQLLYVYVCRAESGGRLFNVAANRILACCVFMSLLMILTIALNRRVYTDIIGAAVPLLIVIAFKFFVVRPLERQFKYYNPSPQEAEEEWNAVMGEKRTHHRDMEKRFLHPALQNNELFTVMVHKKQEALARDVMSAYPWFNPKVVAEDRLEFDPNRDRANDADWETGSIASSRMLDGRSEMGVKSEFGSTLGPDRLQAYYQQGHMARSGSDLGITERGSDLGYANPLDRSSDNLLSASDYAAQQGPMRKASVREYNPRKMTDDPISVRPLLETDSEVNLHQPMSRQPSTNSFAPPYPPSRLHSPPVGYTPPAMPGMSRNQSYTSSDGGRQDDRAWGHGQRYN